jgi:hypothetical protein
MYVNAVVLRMNFPCSGHSPQKIGITVEAIKLFMVIISFIFQIILIIIFIIDKK